MDYIGTPFIFEFRTIINGVGLYAQRALVNMGDEIIFIGSDNFYVFDGISLNPISSSLVKNFFFNDINPKYGDRTIGFIVEEDDEIFFWYVSNASTTNEIDKAIVFNYVTKTWSFRNAGPNGFSAWFYYQQFQDFTWQTIPDTPWMDAAGTWSDKRLLASAPLNLAGDENGFVYAYGGVVSQNGQPYQKYAITGDRDFKLPGRNKRLLRVDVGAIRGVATNLDVYVGHRTNVGDTIQYEGPFAFDLSGTKASYITCDITDVYFLLKFETDGTGDPWDVLNYTFYFNKKEIKK